MISLMPHKMIIVPPPLLTPCQIGKQGKPTASQIPIQMVSDTELIVDIKQRMKGGNDPFANSEINVCIAPNLRNPTDYFYTMKRELVFVSLLIYIIVVGPILDLTWKHD